MMLTKIYKVDAVESNVCKDCGATNTDLYIVAKNKEKFVEKCEENKGRCAKCFTEALASGFKGTRSVGVILVKVDKQD